MSLTISLPPSPTDSPRSPYRTNTVIVTGLPIELFQTVALATLRRHFATYGTINQWAPLGSFGRIIIVYENEDAAETAKRESDSIVIEPTSNRRKITLRVYRADSNPLIPIDGPVTVPQSAYLRPPPIEKNFLVSPPGSPPVGWEQVKEEPPNAAPLAVDLIEALRKLRVRRVGSCEVLLEPGDGNGVGVYVEDCGDYDSYCDGLDWREKDGHDWVYGEPSPRIKWKPIATAIPPMPTAVM